MRPIVAIHWWWTTTFSEGCSKPRSQTKLCALGRTGPKGAGTWQLNEMIIHSKPVKGFWRPPRTLSLFSSVTFFVSEFSIFLSGSFAIRSDKHNRANTRSLSFFDSTILLHRVTSNFGELLVIHGARRTELLSIPRLEGC